MDTIGERIQQLRKEKGLSQTELAKETGVSYAQISRYENKGAQPPAEVLNNLSRVLNTSIDFLVNGNASEKGKNSLTDAKVLNQFIEVDQLPDNEKNTILKVVSALVRDYKTKQAYAS